MYADGRFARHPRFRYFALNTEMRWRALQAGRIYVRQHQHDTHMMPSSFSSIVLTWLLFISTIIVLQSQALRCNVYIGMFAQARPPPMPCIRLVRVLRSARLRHVSLTWLLSPLLARDTSDRPAVIFQPSDSYTCGAIPLEHRHVLGPGGQWLQQWVGPTVPRRAASGQYARAPRIRPK